ncbi:hypothetical protein FRC07_012804 [Ceratobasidium sp. 392]|nr:hypothetical protein FRC07_012804 [Ceratobasidium sp. 392]
MLTRSGLISCGNNPYARGRATLCALPNDILLKIVEVLDAQSAVALARICKALYIFATSRPAWLAIARNISRTGVLPLPLHKSYPTPASLSTPNMKAAIRRAINTQHVLGRASPATHVHPYLGGSSNLRSTSAYSLLSDQTVVHTAFLPGGRFLLTVQLDSSFACWDLKSPTRTRCVRLQTGSDANIDEERVEPRCVAYWKTGAAYVEFAHDVVEEGDAIIVALLVVDTIPDQQALSRNLHVVRIELPTPNSRRRTRPMTPDRSMYGMRLLASAPIPHPLFVCSSYVHASGHAGLIGNCDGSEVIFTLFFNPRPPPSISALPSTFTLAEASAAPGFQASSRVALIQCNFQTKPTRFYALGSADRIILYCESGGCVYSYTHGVADIRAQAFAQPYDADTLIVPAPAPHEDPFPEGEHGTPGAPCIQKMIVMLRKPAPAWLEHGEDWVEQVTRQDEMLKAERAGALPVGTERISAMSMTIDAETSNLDAFRGLVIGAHDVDIGRKSVPVAPSANGMTSAAASTTRPHHVPDLHPSSSPPPTPSTFGPQSPLASTSSLTSLPVPPVLAPLPAPPPPQPTRYRRECRVRYKRTVFPSRLSCTWHELAALGTHGRHAVWIEGDGPPPEEDGVSEVPPPPISPENLRDESASLRVMLASVDAGSAGQAPKEIVVPPNVRGQLGRVSCVAFEDSLGMLAMATLDGKIILLEFA